MDLLYSRYGSGAKDILQMDFEEGIEMITTAQRMNNDEKLFIRWVFSYQTTMKFDDFKAKLEGNVQEDSRTEDEILDSVRLILESCNNGTEYI